MEIVEFGLTYYEEIGRCHVFLGNAIFVFFKESGESSKSLQERKGAKKTQNVEKLKGGG